MSRADLAPLVAVIGQAAAAALVAARPGQTVAVPARAGGQGWGRLVELVGVPAANKLVRAMPRAEIYIPKNDGELIRDRNARIRTQYDAGQTVQDIALEHRLTERWVYAILGRSDEDDAQLALF